MSETSHFIDALTRLKAGDLSLLRLHSGQDLDESIQGFDLFTGIWWPLRQRSQRAPRRDVAWLVAKLFAKCPITREQNKTLAAQLRRTISGKDPDKELQQTRRRFDDLLLSPLHSIEPHLQWALDKIASKELTLDWVKLTDDLSYWERDSTRLKWAEEFLNKSKGENHAY